MTMLDRIRRMKNTWDIFSLSLEIADYVSHGQIRRAIYASLHPEVRNDPLFLGKEPATTTIKVKSEREGPIQ